MGVMLDGIDDLGQLVYYIREAHRKKREQISTEAGVSLSQISRLETSGEMGYASFRKYVEVLDLDYDQRILLIDDLYNQFRSPDRIQSDERRFDQIRFSALKTADTFGYSDLRKNLEGEELPSYIRDELWFVHAYNYGMLNLFNLNDGDLKNNWAMWHIIGSRFYPRSKFALAHGGFAHLYYPQSLKHFFDQTARFFFTTHMKVLRDRLWSLGSRPYRQWWNSVTSLNTPYVKTEQPPRVIDYGARSHLIRSYDEPFTVTTESGEKIKYFKVTWEGYNAQTTKLMTRYGVLDAAIGPVMYASDYVDEYNSWPEMSKFRQSRD